MVGLDYFRTILHDFECSLICFFFGFMICSHYVAYVRVIFGPLPILFCWIEAFGRNSMGVGLCLMCFILISTRVSNKYPRKFIGLKLYPFSVLVHFCD